MGKFIEETGNRYGRWTVISQAENDGGQARWHCRCDCGTEKVVAGRSLRSGLSKSCGCLNSELSSKRRLADLAGQQFGRWTVIERAENTRLGRPRWLCQCSCGKIRRVQGSNLHSGGSKSCGCLNNELTTLRNKGRKGKKGHYSLPEGEAAFNTIVSNMKRGAKKRGLEWALTKEQVRTLTHQPCHYCGTMPQRATRFPNLHGQYIYNGLDRVDNDRGYVLENIVPCCKTCNVAKNNATVEEFEAWAHRLSKHLAGIQP